MKTNVAPEIICIAHLKAKENKKEELLHVLQGLIKLSKNEPGCISYQLHQSSEHPNLFTFIDKFKNQDAFDAHCETQHIKEAFDNLIPPLIESIDITLHQEIFFTD